MNDIEAWSGIDRFPGYEASTHGRVRSVRRVVVESGTGRVRTQKGKVLSTKRLLKGYPSVCMSIENKKFDVCVHVLVAETFVGPKSGQVRHLDGDRFNNRPVNLCWGTAAENAADRDAHGTTAAGERAGNRKLTWASVGCMRQLSRNGVQLSRIALLYGVSKSTAHSVITNKTWKTKL